MTIAFSDHDGHTGILLDGVLTGMLAKASRDAFLNAYDRPETAVARQLATIRHVRSTQLTLFTQTGDFAPTLLSGGYAVIGALRSIPIGAGELILPTTDFSPAPLRADGRSPAELEVAREEFLAAQSSRLPDFWLVSGPDDPRLDAIRPTPAEVVEELRRLMQAVFVSDPEARAFPPNRIFQVRTFGWRDPMLATEHLFGPLPDTTVQRLRRAWGALVTAMEPTHDGHWRHEVPLPSDPDYHRANTYMKLLVVPLLSGPFSAQETAAARRLVADHPLLRDVVSG